MGRVFSRISTIFMTVSFMGNEAPAYPAKIVYNFTDELIINLR
jgi:hypothetical protein